ncbi:MAG: retropepsin-like aspartic protease, partial [Anaerolineales bacterium]|nr:retropepsin-like aspartic protease [Anaerolineales bacterium]
IASKSLTSRWKSARKRPIPEFDAKSFDTPAPVAYVTLPHPATGASLSDVPMLMDTGADVTLLPRDVAEQLGIEPVAGRVYELQGFDGETKLAEVVRLELAFLGRKFTGQFLLIDQPFGIMGRNILNAVALLLDGPHGIWEEQKR